VVDPADITPTLEQVAAHIHTRTRADADGLGAGTVELGTFTEATVPTATQAAERTQYAARRVALLLGDVGTAWTGDLEASAVDVVSIYAAYLIETSFYSDTAQADESLPRLAATWMEARDALIATAKNNQTGGKRFGSIRMVTSQAVLDAEAEEVETP
jgi:hypothetical protein